MGKFCQYLTELYAHHTSVFLFQDDNLSKYQLIFIKLGMYIDMEIWFGIDNGQILLIFDRVIYQSHNSGRGIIISHFFYTFFC